MRLLVLAAAAFFCAGSAAHADPVVYTLTGTFTGTIGTSSFTDASGTFTLNSDTSDIVAQGGGFYTNTAGVSTITLAGIGTATFLSSTFGAYSAFDAAGFYDTANSFGADDYDPLNPAMASYALTSPFTDTGYLLFGSSSASELTSLGELTLTGDYGSSVTFTASSAVSPIPEPSSMILLATGVLGTIGILRKRLA
jgi:hypothetical protein